MIIDLVDNIPPFINFFLKSQGNNKLVKSLTFLAFTAFTAYRFVNELGPNVPNNMLKSPFFLLFSSQLFHLQPLTINTKDIIILMIPLNSLFGIITVVIPDPKTVF